jgi:hypothetical protein
LGIKARLVAVRTYLIILSRAHKTAARIDATIIWYGLERGKKLSARPGNLEALKPEFGKCVTHAFK